MRLDETESKMNSKFQDITIAPMHTAEHLLNQTMVRMFGCQRSRNAHIERKKSKINYQLIEEPTAEQICCIERKMNELIEACLPVTYELIRRTDIPDEIPLDRLPDNVGDVLRLVHIGNYDVCACIGCHVAHTGELGGFKINSTSYQNGQFRIVFKLQEKGDKANI